MQTTPQSRIADRLRLSKLTFEIEGLESALATLRYEQKLIVDRLETYKYPVLTLPNELVWEIFLQYIPAYPARPPLRGDGSPEKLAQICRRWREIAHNTPELWRSVHILPHPSNKTLALVNQWMERSRTLPLSIRFWTNNQDSHAASMIQALLAFRSRWEYVALRIPPNDPVIPRIEGNFPKLARISLSLHQGVHFGSLTSMKLSKAYLWCPIFVEQVDILPWAQLTTLFLEAVFHDVVSFVLRQTRALVRCRLSQVDFDDQPMVDTPVRMALETLIVDFCNPKQSLGAALLRPLHLPRLKRLRISDGVTADPSLRLHTLVSLIDGFGCSLDRLCIISRSLSIEECRAAFPGIAEVEVATPKMEIDPQVWGHWNRDYDE
ncbi:F-box domain-containing protein [Mycena kentingensis (nom. inval.)]|nr:F-box domain-containing protein [Mycena kentingensis (nom. inval.)]